MWNYHEDNAVAVFLRAVSQDYFKADSKTDMAALRSQNNLYWMSFCGSSGQSPAKRMAYVNQIALDFPPSYCDCL